MNQKDRDIRMKIISQESREIGNQNKLFHNEKNRKNLYFIYLFLDAIRLQVHNIANK